MKIEDRRIDGLVMVSDLKVGDVFEADGEIMMRTTDLMKASNGTFYNAVKLSNGNLCCFPLFDKDVRKLNAKLVIEDMEDEVTDE